MRGKWAWKRGFFGHVIFRSETEKKQLQNILQLDFYPYSRTRLTLTLLLHIETVTLHRSFAKNIAYKTYPFDPLKFTNAFFSIFSIFVFVISIVSRFFKLAKAPSVMTGFSNTAYDKCAKADQHGARPGAQFRREAQFYAEFF